jgi:hypothetical protein
MFDAAKRDAKPGVVLGLIACLLGLMISSGAGAATTRKTAPEPAATLLLPYFEVDLGNPSGLTTLLSVNNSSPQAVLAQVTVWSDLSVPVLNFTLYLTGYDVQAINLRDILVNGFLPRTASAGQDPADTISPHGPLSQDINFASCAGLLPPPNLPASFIQHLQLSLTGKPSPILGNLCAGRDLGDNIARGYVTVDTVNNCTLRLPSDPGYFGAGGTGDASNQNVLWGDYFSIDSANNTAEGNTLVHIVADATDVETSSPGRYTFYGRYVGWSAADNRRPLATNFAARFVNGGIFSGGTSLIVWRDSKLKQTPFTCPATAGSRPSWYRLGQEVALIFDEQEQVQVPQSVPSSPLQSGFAPFPAEAQRVAVGGSDFPVPYSFGWLSLNLNTLVGPAGLVPPVDPEAAQAWVTVKMLSSGRFSVGFDAIQLDNAAHAIHYQSKLPPPEPTKK